MRIKTVPRQMKHINNLAFTKRVVTKQIFQLEIKDCVDVKQELPEVQDSLVWKQIILPEIDPGTLVPVKKYEAGDIQNLNNEVLDLSTTSLTHPSSSNNLFKDTYLYKIMTDPDFLEKIQRNKINAKHICLYCKKEFESEEELMNHHNFPTNASNQITCCACSKTFSQKRYLRYHQRCHSDRNKYTCDICTRKYSRLDNLTRHNILHTNPTKFPCSICERAFARKDLLNKHEKCHENKHRYQCNICKKYFKGFVSLQYHHYVIHLEKKI